MLANFGSSVANATVGMCAPTPCTLSQSVSAEITTNAGASIVAEREMFFHFDHLDRVLNRTTRATGGTDVVGQSGAAVASAYSFAEGYAYAGYQVSLTVQTTDKSVFVAERPLYWNASGTQGGDDVLGYLGG